MKNMKFRVSNPVQEEEECESVESINNRGSELEGQIQMP